MRLLLIGPSSVKNELIKPNPIDPLFLSLVPDLNLISRMLESLPPYSAGKAPLINRISCMAFELNVLAIFPMC